MVHANTIAFTSAIRKKQTHKNVAISPQKKVLVLCYLSFAFSCFHFYLLSFMFKKCHFEAKSQESALRKPEIFQNFLHGSLQCGYFITKYFYPGKPCVIFLKTPSSFNPLEASWQWFVNGFALPGVPLPAPGESSSAVLQVQGPQTSWQEKSVEMAVQQINQAFVSENISIQADMCYSS